MTWRLPDPQPLVWVLVITEDDESHHMPDNDVVAHVARGDCICGPTWQRMTDGEGELWLTMHYALRVAS